MSDNEFEMAVRNWVRWAVERMHSGMRCKSIEHRYKSPQTWHALEPSTQIDTIAAEKVEETVVAMPRQSRCLIVFGYLKPTKNLWLACRDAGIKTHDFEEKFALAKNMLNERLTAT